MDETAKKEALRLFTYGLYVATVGTREHQNAFTVNWATQVSFDPPMVALSVENDGHSLPIIRETKRFALNILAKDERDLAGRLGKPYSRHPEKDDDVTFDFGEGNTPVLANAPAWVVVEVTGEMPAGDSTLFVGRVVDAKVNRKVEPLTMLEAGFKHAG